MNSLIFTTSDIKKIVSHTGIDGFMDEAISELHATFSNYKEDKYSIPMRSGFEYNNPHLGLLEWMPSFEHNGNIAIKIVGYHPTNPIKHALPSVLSTSLVFSSVTGNLHSIMDSTFLTAVRTGAASALASQVLASPESTAIGLVGCGAQAVTQLHGLSRIFAVTKVLIFDTELTAMTSFAERISGLNLNVQIILCNLAELCSQADIICSSTSVAIGNGPVITDSQLKSHLHINAVGSDFPGKIELPLSLLKRSLVCPDFKIQALHEGECQQLSEQAIGPDIVSLIQQSDQYRCYQNTLSVFDSTGWALEDFAMTNLICRYAQKLGLGTPLNLSSSATDCKNPYDFLALDNHLLKELPSGFY